MLGEASALPNELPEESDQFRFLHSTCLSNLNFTGHDWVVYKLGTLLGSVGHKVKIHIKGALVKTQVQDNHLPPPHTLIMDFTMTHVRFGSSHFHPIGQFTHTRRSEVVK